MRPSIRRTLQLIVEHTPAGPAAEAGKALTRDDDLIGLRRVAAYARHLPISELPREDRDAVIDAQRLAADTRPAGPGRPPTGTPIHTRLPDWIVSLLDSEVQAGLAASRADLIRSVLTDWAEERHGRP